MISLSAFKDILRPSKLNSKAKLQFLDVYFAIYHTLFDDDDDIRNEGASIVSYILAESTGGIRLKPLVAASTLLKFLGSIYANSKNLSLKATTRMMGVKAQNSERRNSEGAVALHLEPVSNLMSTARQEDHSLFAEEKQNLYRDDVQETQRIAQLLLFLQPSAVDPAVVCLLRDWTLAGLETLIETAKAEGQDGPLGWTSKPAVYTLGMRIIVVAKVIINWDLADERGREIEWLAEAVKQFLEVGALQGLHGLWMKEAEMVMKVVEGRKTTRNVERYLE